MTDFSNCYSIICDCNFFYKILYFSVMVYKMVRNCSKYCRISWLFFRILLLKLVGLAQTVHILVSFGWGAVQMSSLLVWYPPHPEQIWQNKNITVIYKLFGSVGQFVTFLVLQVGLPIFWAPSSLLGPAARGLFLRGWPKAHQKGLPRPLWEGT